MDRLEHLTFRLLDAALAEDEADELDDLLHRDAATAEQFTAQLHLEAALRGAGPIPDVAASTVASVQSSGEQDLERAVMRTISELPAPPWSVRPVRRRRLKVLLVVAASLAVVTTVAFWNDGRLAHRAQLPTIANAEDAGRRVAEGERVVAGDDEQIRLAYADGTTVDLFEPAELVVAVGPGPAKRIQLLHGGLELDVAPQPADRPLIVVTPEGEVRVLGTKFRLTAGAERTRIEMEEGKIAFVHRADGRTTEVSEGAYLVVEPRSQNVIAQPLPPTLSAPLWSRRKTGSALAMSADGRQLAVAGRHGGVIIFEPRSGEIIADWSTEKDASDPTQRPLDLAFAPGDHGLWAVDHAGRLTRWNLADGVPTQIALGVDVGVVRTFGDGGRLFGHSLGKGYQRQLQLWDLAETETPQPRHVWRSREDLWGAAVSPRGNLAAIGSRTGKLHLLDIASGEELTQAQVGRGAVMRLALAADERHLAYHSAQEGIRLFTLPDFAPAATWMPEGPSVTALGFSLDGRWLAAGLADRTVRIWSVAERRAMLLIKLSGDCARQLMFSPDGRLLATAGTDTAVWEMPWSVEP